VLVGGEGQALYRLLGPLFLLQRQRVIGVAGFAVQFGPVEPGNPGRVIGRVTTTEFQLRLADEPVGLLDIALAGMGPGAYPVQHRLGRRGELVIRAPGDAQQLQRVAVLAQVQALAGHLGEDDRPQRPRVGGFLSDLEAGQIDLSGLQMLALVEEHEADRGAEMGNRGMHFLPGRTALKIAVQKSG
jgi:hypothetical protein